MLTKIYLILLALAVLTAASFGYYAWSWLQSIGDPKIAVENYAVWENYYSLTVYGASLILLITANVILWTQRNSWALWTTLGYFAVFVLLDYFWLGETYFQFKKANGLWEGGFSVGTILGLGICVAAAVLIFLNQFVILRLNERMFPAKELPSASIEEVKSVTDNTNSKVSN